MLLHHFHKSETVLLQSHICNIHIVYTYIFVPLMFFQARVNGTFATLKAQATKLVAELFPSILTQNFAYNSIHRPQHHK